MRSNYVPCLIFVLLVGSLNAQIHVPLFGEPTRMWTTYFGGTVNAQCLDHWLTTYSIHGDTLIDQVQYKVIRSRTRYWETTIVSMFCNAWSEYDGPTYFVREDGLRVYFMCPWPEGTDALIYDFGADVGDTIPEPGICAPENWTLQGWGQVIAVDSIMVDGSYRRQMHAVIPGAPEGPDTVAVIGGIGATTGPFSALSFRIGLSHGYGIVCVRELGEVIFGDQNCEFIMGTGNVGEDPGFAPYPNPTQGLIVLGDRSKSYEIWDRLGHLIHSGDGNSADLTNDDEGLYFLRVWPRYGGPAITTKLIVHRP